MPDRSSLTAAQRDLLDRVAKGTHSSVEQVELCALHTLVRLGHLVSTHDDKGFHFTVAKASKAKRSRTKKPAKG